MICLSTPAPDSVVLPDPTQSKLALNTLDPDVENSAVSSTGCATVASTTPLALNSDPLAIYFLD